MKVTLKKVRLAFPALFEAKAVGAGGADSSMYFKAAFPIEPDSKNHKLIEAAIADAVKEKWGAKGTKIREIIEGKGDSCFVEDGIRNKDGDVYDGFEGMYSLNSGRKEDKGRPTIVDRDGRTQLLPADGKPYAGCYVTALLDIWAQDNSWGRRINCELRGIQFVKDGDAFGGGAAAGLDEFEELEEIEDSEEDEFA